MAPPRRFSSTTLATPQAVPCGLRRAAQRQCGARGAFVLMAAGPRFPRKKSQPGFARVLKPPASGRGSLFSTLSAVVLIKCPCRCVSVVAQVWGSSSCLPSPAKAPPSGPGWLHEIKHDGFRIMARKDAAGVRLIPRAGTDFSSRFPFITTTVSKLPVRSCLIDGEAIVCDENGLAVFDLIRRNGALASAVLCAFDLLELDGRDLRREPIEKRKA